VDPRIALAQASRDSYLAIRRVERQQALIERLVAAHGDRVPLDRLADEIGVSPRTIARDVDRLRFSGVPVRTHPGRGGGVSIPPVLDIAPIAFDLPEIAALMSSLTVLGPTVSPSAAAAMAKLTAAIAPDQTG